MYTTTAKILFYAKIGIHHYNIAAIPPNHPSSLDKISMEICLTEDHI